MRKKNILLVLATFAFSQILTAQNEREITLNEAIALARTQSVDAAVALNELKTAYWEYRTLCWTSAGSESDRNIAQL